MKKQDLKMTNNAFEFKNECLRSFCRAARTTARNIMRKSGESKLTKMLTEMADTIQEIAKQNEHVILCYFKENEND